LLYSPLWTGIPLPEREEGDACLSHVVLVDFRVNPIAMQYAEVEFRGDGGDKIECSPTRIMLLRLDHLSHFWLASSYWVS
jgi:hypothetical protein